MAAPEDPSARPVTVPLWALQTLVELAADMGELSKDEWHAIRVARWRVEQALGLGRKR